ncbi:MAG: radical SAM protein [bacterium]
MDTALDTLNYRKLYESGELEKRIEKAYRLLEDCSLCPRKCGVNRKKGETGVCKSGEEVEVSSFHSHFGEEPPISGYRGSGTIFLAHCNLRCLFCQNYPISHLGNGNKVSTQQLAQMMLSLQKRGCHNINLVTPTHFIPQILSGFSQALEKGLNIPLVYNCSGYENVETLQLLEGVVDIYMPDLKYGTREAGEKYSSAPDYFEKAKKAIKEMHRQVGDLRLNREGIAQRGLLVRHLVLPNGLAGTRKVFAFLAEEISSHTYISIMSQYFPAYKAQEFKELNRRITRQEYQQALDIANELGLERGWRQD